MGNEGQTEVLVDTSAPVRKPRPPRAGGQTRTDTPANTPDTESPLRASVEALEGHVATLKDQLAKAEAHAAEMRTLAADRSKEVAIERERVADLTSQLLRITQELLTARKVEVPVQRSWWQRLVG